MKKIKGRYTFKDRGEDKEVSTSGEWTVGELANMISNNHFAILLLKGYDIIDEKTGCKAYYPASALTLYPNETIPKQEGNKIVIPTYFRRNMLAFSGNQENLDELVKVDCLVDLNDDSLYVSISKNE